MEDLLEEARKEGGGDVAEAEVHMGFEVRGDGREELHQCGYLLHEV